MVNGIEETEDFSNKDFPFLSLALEALVYRFFEMKHEFHELIDSGSEIIKEEMKDDEKCEKEYFGD